MCIAIPELMLGSVPFMLAQKGNLSHKELTVSKDHGDGPSGRAIPVLNRASGNKRCWQEVVSSHLSPAAPAPGPSPGLCGITAFMAASQSHLSQSQGCRVPFHAVEPVSQLVATKTSSLTLFLAPTPVFLQPAGWANSVCRTSSTAFLPHSKLVLCQLIQLTVECQR